ncbi:DUF805 domain-containing protein [Pelagibacterium lentulum]|uniref:DUF805 domain-containing protein n=1 Tax=Pelagibacterium lentulum TaxID=2029865 RepID=A0A916RCG3_9HYPH|nr:DUF805 domain-containing protein [Pelagibacterium lentulum]GGA46373.1 DUF805 domain-containing protein [Pelagibacterium lentulum]
MELFTTFDGRLNRQRFWLGVLVLIVASLVLGIVLSLLLGGMGEAGLSLASLLLYLLMLYPGLAIAIKRLHDRNKSAMPWAIIFFGPGLLLQIMQVLGIGFYPVQFESETLIVPDMLGMIVTLASAVVGIWALIELGFLKGTKGPNAFGPDPLEQ